MNAFNNSPCMPHTGSADASTTVFDAGSPNWSMEFPNTVGQSPQMNALPEPLTDDEFEHLAEFLYGLHGTAMTLEEMDGFFCALICGPERVPASEYLPHIWGDELTQGRGFKTIEEAQCIMNLLTRHWNHIAGTLSQGEVYVPMVFDNEDGIVMGNQWAIGFEPGIDLRRDSWGRLVDGDKCWKMLAPVMLLAHEHDLGSDMRSVVFIPPEARKEILYHLPVCTLMIYEFFKEETAGRK